LFRDLNLGEDAGEELIWNSGGLAGVGEAGGGFGCGERHRGTRAPASVNSASAGVGIDASTGSARTVGFMRRARAEVLLPTRRAGGRGGRRNALFSHGSGGGWCQWGRCGAWRERSGGCRR